MPSGRERNQLLASDRPVHDWYRFVLSFPPHLVRDYVERFGLDAGATILDPFCGTGTTLVEARKLGIASVGIEALPMSAFAAATKLDWSPQGDALRRDADAIAERAHARLEQDGGRDEPGAAAPSPLLTLPPEQQRLLLRNSISPLPLHKALVLRDAIEQFGSAHTAHLRLALARELPTTIGNLRFGPEVGLGAQKEDIAAIFAWRDRMQVFARDLDDLREIGDAPASVVQADARDIAASVPERSIDCVITSPPYPNEKDYTRAVRLESVILGLLADNNELRAIKRGLLRSNSRGVYKGDDDDAWVAAHPEVQALAAQIEQTRLELGKTSGFERMYHRVPALYFGGMARHFASLRRVLKPGAQLAYVVGDQASYLRVMIRTADLLAGIAERLGYEVVGKDLFRTRAATGTRSELREEVLVLQWGGCDGARCSATTLWKRPLQHSH